MDSEQLDEIMQEGRLEYSSEPQRCYNCLHFATDEEVLGDGGLCTLRYQAKVFSTGFELVDCLSENIMDNDGWCVDYELDEEKLA